MRLLDARALIHQGVSRLVHDHDIGSPHYAILSHTWGKEEVLFEDISLGPNYEITTLPTLRRAESGYDLNSRLDPSPHERKWRELGRGVREAMGWLETPRKTGICSQCESIRGPIVPAEKPHVKAGWNKVWNTCLQACRDGYDYVWIDTCCIDKSCSAELSEALNSMFKWYEDSAACYVHLDDCNLCPDLRLDASNLFGKIEHWLYPVSRCTTAQIRHCRWLSRGWTLQELIAPREIAFFDRRWKFIANVSTIRQVLTDATGISESLFNKPHFWLAGLSSNVHERREDLRAFPIAEKMSWAANRETSRIEDRAYCLLGLFDINMPLLYGEGERAFIRLQEEILKTSADHSILAWEFRHPLEHEVQGSQVLAPSPGHFSWLASFRRSKPDFNITLACRTPGRYNRSFGMNNEGLSIWLRLYCRQEEDASNITLALLDAGIGANMDGQPSLQIALRLRQTILDDHYLYSEVTSMKPSESEYHLADDSDSRRLAFIKLPGLELEPRCLMIRRGPEGY